VDEYQKAVDLRNKNLPIFFSIVGESPLEHIEYILKNGMKRFNYYLDCLEEGTLYAPATVNEYRTIVKRFEIRGGSGNKILAINIHSNAITKNKSMEVGR
jgi:hypothetical protein